jgi:hypothetical protein
MRALAGEMQHSSPADIAARASNQRDLPPKFAHDTLPRFFRDVEEKASNGNDIFWTSPSSSAAPNGSISERIRTRPSGIVWVGGCKNWYTSQQPTPVLWPFPQSEHKAFFEQVPRGRLPVHSERAGSLNGQSR